MFIFVRKRVKLLPTYISKQINLTNIGPSRFICLAGFSQGRPGNLSHPCFASLSNQMGFGSLMVTVRTLPFFSIALFIESAIIRKQDFQPKGIQNENSRSTRP